MSEYEERKMEYARLRPRFFNDIGEERNYTKRHVRCYNCQKVGHVAKNCFKKETENKNGNEYFFFRDNNINVKNIKDGDFIKKKA
ncbi:hypothetical protein GVAV_001473 [Gurleya vavrai]